MIDKQVFIKNFLIIMEHRLNKVLPKRASEGQYVFRAYQAVARALAHIINVNLGEKDK